MVVFVSDEQMIDADTAFFPCLPPWDTAIKIALDLPELNNKTMLNKQQYNALIADWGKSNLRWAIDILQIDVS